MNMPIKQNNKAKKNILKNIAKVVLSGVLAVILLSAFALVYDHAGIHVSNESESTDYVWRSGQIKTTMTEGFAWLKMDENGYNNDAVPEKIDTLLIGSSHMEAVQMCNSENVAGLLNTMCDGDTYNIGISGHTIYRCVDNFENAINEFNPSKYAIIETSMVKLSTTDMQEVLDGKAKKIPSYDSGIVYYAQFIPAFRPIYRQVEDWLKEKNTANTETVVNSQETLLPEGYEDTLYNFLSTVSSTASNKGITPIVFYHPEEILNNDGSVTYATDEVYLDCFISACDKLGIVFVDITDSFKTMYKEEHQLAHGFANTAVATGHLNKYGHRALAQKLGEIIKELEEK